MYILHILITVGLFVLLTPGILVTLPNTKKTSKYTVALVHGLIFAIVMHIFYMYVLPNFIEGFQEGAQNSNKKAAAKSPLAAQAEKNGITETQQETINKELDAQCSSNGRCSLFGNDFEYVSNCNGDTNRTKLEEIKVFKINNYHKPNADLRKTPRMRGC